MNITLCCYFFVPMLLLWMKPTMSCLEGNYFYIYRLLNNFMNYYLLMNFTVFRANTEDTPLLVDWV